METAFTLWLLIIGTLFIVMALTGTTLQRLPLTTAIIYLALGFVLGDSILGMLSIDPLADAALLECVAEIAVLISLFTSGLKLRTPLHEGRWQLPLRLAFGAMTLTVGMIALAGALLLHLPWGAAILLGAILAPTDPVLASDVQVAHPGAYSTDFCHPVHGNVAMQSMGMLPPSPEDFCHPSPRECCHPRSVATLDRMISLWSLLLSMAVALCCPPFRGVATWAADALTQR